ncbi:MAG: NAD(P)-binding domain-containing protein [Gammaproteobacteria bacterium]|nr:NAD(P)-binding domain-containing protein [Gammaproteobacteria bacterium]
MTTTQKTYEWAVVGAGPGGITSVGLLLDAGVCAQDILWIDPYFQVGDFGRLWGEVNSNTRVALFLKQLNSVQSFQYAAKSDSFALDKKDPNGFTELKEAAVPLQWVSDQLCKKVHTIKCNVKALTVEAGAWQLQTETNYFLAKKVIMATGSEPKSLDYPSVEKIDLVTALTPTELKKIIEKNDAIAVFGSSHSAMIAIRNLVEAGAQKIVNFYLSPLRYAVLMDDWILYDDTGLKGETAAWVRENISKNPLPQISRYLATPEHIDEHLPNCNKGVYTVGFQSRHISVQGVSLSQYDVSNGIIAPGLFGIGIGFPIEVFDPFGRREANVGVWKFLKNLKRVLPLWLEYPL